MEGTQESLELGLSGGVTLIVVIWMVKTFLANFFLTICNDFFCEVIEKLTFHILKKESIFNPKCRFGIHSNQQIYSLHVSCLFFFMPSFSAE